MDIEKVASTVMSLDHIDDIINDSKGKENEIETQLNSISKIAQNNNLGEVVGSTIIHKHFEIKPNQIVVWEMCKTNSTIYHPVFER